MNNEDKKYFEELSEKNFRKFQEESERHMGVLLENFQGQVSAVAEQYLSLGQKMDNRFDEIVDILKANQETLIEHDETIHELQAN